MMRLASKDGEVRIGVDDEGVWLNEVMFLGSTRVEVEELICMLQAAREELPEEQ